jgi:hypothetical protein
MNLFLRYIFTICLIVSLITSAQANPNDEFYKKLDLFSDVLNTIKKEYVD